MGRAVLGMGRGLVHGIMLPAAYVSSRHRCAMVVSTTSTLLTCTWPGAWPIAPVLRLLHGM
jgi:hypothetical protein